jgi:hypothetical protein
VNLRRGFWRVTAIVWAFGAGLLCAWSSEVLEDPFENVCRAEVAPPYPECLTEEARRLAESESLAEQLLGRIQGTYGAIDPTKSIPRMQTARYRETLRTLARREAIWAAGAWGLYYLLAWVGSGFGARPGAPAG